MNLARLRNEWSPNITRDLLAGTVVALALIPEAIAFSIIAGVDPRSVSTHRSASRSSALSPEAVPR